MKALLILHLILCCTLQLKKYCGTGILYLFAVLHLGLDKWAKKMDIADGLNDCLAIFSEECKIFGQSDALGKQKHILRSMLSMTCMFYIFFFSFMAFLSEFKGHSS